MEITSAENKKIKELVKLGNKKKLRDEKKLLIVEGIHLMKEIIKSGNEKLILEIFYTEKSLKRNDSEVEKILENFSEDKKFLLPEFLMEKISTTNTPQGFLVLVKKPELEKIEDEKFLVILDKVSEPDNIGAIIRSGVSLGVETFVLLENSADAWSPKSLRASQGAHFHAKIIDNYDGENIKKDFSGKIYGTFLDKDAGSLYEESFSEKIAICLGNEGAGISQEFEKNIDKKIYIPMKNNFESLNVSAAGAVVFSEVLRQKIRS